MKKKRRLLRSDLLWLIAVAVLVLLQFWWLPGDPGTPDDTYSNTIEGKRGFFETLKSLSERDLFPAVQRESEKLIPDSASTLLILGPDRYPDEHEKRELAEFVMNGGNLMFAPNWLDPTFSMDRIGISTTKEYFSKEDTVVSATPVAGSSVPSSTASDSTADTSELPAEAPEDTTKAPITSSNAKPGTPASKTASSRDEKSETKGLIEDALKTKPGMQPNPVPAVGVEEDDFTDVADLSTQSPLVDGNVIWRTRAKMQTGRLNPVVLVATSEGTTQAAMWQYGNGQVLLSASADVFSNRAMLDASQAELAIRMVERLHSEHYSFGDTPIVVSEYLNASDSYRGTGVLMSPSLRSGTLQLIMIAFLAGWFGFHRFGPPRRSTVSERRSLTESATAVGNLFFRTQSGGEAVSGYVDYFRTQLQAMFGSVIRIEDSKTIALRAGLDPDDVNHRINNALGLSGARSTSAPQAAGAIRDLSEILQRLSGNRSN